MNLRTHSTPNDNPFQILSNWHLLKGCIPYVVTHQHGIEVMLSTGVSLRIKAKEATKIPCSLPQLATLIYQGVDLPMIRFTSIPTRSMLPDWVDYESGASSSIPTSSAKNEQPNNRSTPSQTISENITLPRPLSPSENIPLPGSDIRYR